MEMSVDCVTNLYTFSVNFLPGEHRRQQRRTHVELQVCRRHPRVRVQQSGLAQHNDGGGGRGGSDGTENNSNAKETLVPT